ncbi:galactofuranosyltransferase [Dulcicalothrix desertica PCC 7102]|uniref:Galactofuranosyltransferase n=1 Tax=Dulcicalothrix desertica PCC 7102 TaxID=232991 RepID=A0A433VFB7_9CYAN|nr:glycosyltransferase [Dulcicalothrix desertica]RUT04798.1 galactofuranosyltransferase [Dulcicalothrix desertica PCC 7102]TWH42809.1 galactofuranosylgalactofuranosylrhamnosyl-N-acetylglucosaminyl-diphospho-decaprenol beta-1,5/1,6-galactofuranosyltransferase [Dulcicalothrix desertica PCC 7102]
MQVISRLQLPNTLDTSDLYLKLEGNPSIDFDAHKVILHQSDKISFNTYFNSIYESFYTQYTILNEFKYQLKLTGAFKVVAYRERFENQKELIKSERVENQDLSNYVEFSLPLLKSSPDAGRIYLEITCLSEDGLFVEGSLVTQQEKVRDVNLAIITCTFKKEAYVTKTVNAITLDNLLQNKKFKLFVVDNGKTLKQSDFNDSRVTLVPNRNVGGSGGFTKGLIEALQSGVYTHFLFMDDDIDLDSEVIYKLFSLYEYGKQDFAIAGSMLDLYRKHILYEAGALYNKYTDKEGNVKDSDFATVPLKHEADLSDSSALNSLLLEDNIDYGAFWFFAFSKEVVDNIGLPLPFFIKIDDMEFGLRVKQYLNQPIVAFPSIAVWHEPFYAKNPGWDAYYCMRNMLVTNAIHGYSKYWVALKNLSGAVIYNLLLFDYNNASIFIKAFDDFLAGPDFIKQNDAEILHTQICKYSKSHKTQTATPSSVNLDKDYKITKVGKVQKLVSLLTLNGHLLPSFMIRDESAFISYPRIEAQRDSICKAFSNKRIVMKVNDIPVLYQNELDQRAAFSILSAWMKSVVKTTLQWSNINKQWKEAADEFTSLEFWQTYLKPRQS